MKYSMPRHLFFRVTVTEKATGDIIANRNALAEQEADDWFSYYDLLYGASPEHSLIKQNYKPSKPSTNRSNCHA